MPESGTTSGTTSGTAAGRAGGGRRCSRRLGTWAPGAALLVPGPAWAAAFKQAPGVENESGAGGPDTILGLIHINTAFFIAVGVIAFFWFLFGGGRRAKLRGKDH